MTKRLSSPCWLAFAAALGSLVSNSIAQPASVVVDEVRYETVELWRQVTGEIHSLRRSKLAAQEPGFVVELPVLEGDSLKAGEVIAVLDTTLAKIAIESTQAQIQGDQSDIRRIGIDHAQAKRDLERFQAMSRKDASSVTELDRARTAVERLEAQLARAEAQLLSSQIRHRETIERMEDMTIRAPFDARVTAKHTELGQWLSRGDEVVELVSLQEIEARLDIPESLIGRMHEGKTKVRVVIEAIRTPLPDDPDRTMAHEQMAVLWRIIPDADPLTRQFSARIPITNPGQRARPGMSVIGFVPAGGFAPEITIHKDAILRDDAGEYVFMDRRGKAMPVRIRSKFAVGDRVAIMAGQLQPGDRVVVEGNERLFATQDLMVISGFHGNEEIEPSDRATDETGPRDGG